MAATLDHLSNGRFELGLGAGWNFQESDAYGIPLGELRDRSDRLEEGVEVIRSLLKRLGPTLASSCLVGPRNYGKSDLDHDRRLVGHRGN